MNEEIKARKPLSVVKWWKKTLEDLRLQRLQRIKDAGRHKCIKVCSGTLSRVTTGSKILKRARILFRFYQCKICGRDMTVTKHK